MKGDPTNRFRLVSFGVHAGLCLASLSVCGHEAAAQATHSSRAASHMPPGAFLRQPSPTVAMLVKQVKSDPQVAIRYARLFHLPVKMVPMALEQLHVKNLSEDHILQVHYVAANEGRGDKLVYKPRRVKKGTSVYCLPDGTPLLVRVCGNPIRSRLSPELYSATPVPDFTPGEALMPPPVSSTLVAAPAPRAVPPPEAMLPVIPVVLAENVLAPTELPLAPPALTPPELRAASLPPVYHWVHGGFGLSGLAAPLALLPLLGLGGGSGHIAGIPLLPVTGVSTIIPPANSETVTSPAESSTITLPANGATGTPEFPISSLPGQTSETLGGSPGTPGFPGAPIIAPIVPSAQVTPEPGSVTLALTLLAGAGWISVRKRRGR